MSFKNEDELKAFSKKTKAKITCCSLACITENTKGSSLG